MPKRLGTRALDDCENPLVPRVSDKGGGHLQGMILRFPACLSWDVTVTEAQLTLPRLVVGTCSDISQIPFVPFFMFSPNLKISYIIFKIFL